MAPWYWLTSLDGRINRLPYWLGSLILLAIGCVLVLILIALSPYVGPQGSWIKLPLSLFLLALSAPLVVKRLHDRNKSEHFAWLLYAPFSLSMVFDFLGITSDEPNVPGVILAVINAVIAIWFFIELGCLRGTVGPNRFGPDPLASSAAPPKP
jgi:uncharacterized membrane protein YhaH (DUF805 family)